MVASSFRCCCLLIALGGSIATSALDTYTVLVETQGTESFRACDQIIPIEKSQPYRLLTNPSSIEIVKINEHLDPTDETILQEKTLSSSPATTLVRIYGTSVESVTNALHSYCQAGLVQSFLINMNAFVSSISSQLASSDEIVPLVSSGSPENRIDIVLMGDGYTSSERDLFFNDMNRMTRDMFEADTFAPYLPLFNIWALFRPSVESGLGTHGKPRDTAFGLYRDGTELRGVYTSKSWDARRACKAVGPSACDFPSLIANDPYYGGLGGEFTISTASKTSGTTVLRHEMGHNFGDVGEEYDGGYVYSGANSDGSSSSAPSWKHWLSKSSDSNEVEDMVMLAQAYPWKNLVGLSSYDVKFKSTGTYKRWQLRLTVSNMESETDFEIMLDGKPLTWKWNGLKDRSFYSWNGNSGFTKGSHTITMRTKETDPAILRQICSLTLHEYKGEDDGFHMDDNEYIGMYPTWSIYGRKSYRPNNEKCLMRNMESTKFCTVCYENMWLKFFAKVQLIDDVSVVRNKNGDDSIEVKVLPLASKRSTDDPFRKISPSIVEKESYSTTWWYKNKEQPQFKDQFEVKARGMKGSWKVKVEFKTPMVRYDPKKLLQSTQNFNV